ncbi:MAG: ferrous iron transport protein A [Flavobacterium sp.]
MAITLDSLLKNQKATIVGFDVVNTPLKLIEMGCMEGQVIVGKGKAPFGDPLLFEVNQTQIAIRKESAQLIEIEILSN